MTIVAKFGGTSVASAAQVQKVAEIVRSNSDRRYVIVSAPGKQYKSDQKITDLLILALDNPVEREEALKTIEAKFTALAEKLGIECGLKSYLENLRKWVHDGERDWVLSRGEYLSGLIVSKYLDWPLIDPVTFIRFNAHGEELSNYSCW